MRSWLLAILPLSIIVATGLVACGVVGDDDDYGTDDSRGLPALVCYSP